MSSILNRLKAVEGATFKREGGAADRPPSRDPSPCDCGLPIADCALEESRTSPTRPTGAKCVRSDVTVWLYRLLPGVIVLLAMLMLWRPWGSQSPVGKPLSQGAKPNAAVSRRESSPLRLHPSALKETQGERLADAKPQGTSPTFEATSSRFDAEQDAPPPLSEASDAESRSVAEIRNTKSKISTEPAAETRAAAAIAPNDASVKAFLRNLSITGVYQDAAGAIAFINGRSLKEGDELEQVQIVEIRSGRITFAHQGKRYVLPLP